MAKENQFLTFSQFLFWDVDSDSLDKDLNAVQIISRVLQRGTIADFKLLQNIYERNEIINAIKQTRYLDDKTLNFCSIYFEIPKTEIRCYMLKQSLPQHFGF